MPLTPGQHSTGPRPEQRSTRYRTRCEGFDHGYEHDWLGPTGKVAEKRCDVPGVPGAAHRVRRRTGPLRVGQVREPDGPVGPLPRAGAGGGAPGVGSSGDVRGRRDRGAGGGARGGTPEVGCCRGSGVARRHHHQPAADPGILRRGPARLRTAAGGGGPATLGHTFRPPAGSVAVAGRRET